MSVAETPEQVVTPDPSGRGLFDAGAFDTPELRLPDVDDNRVDRIALKYTGSPELDRSNPDHVSLFRDIHLGQRLRLIVEVECVSYGGKGTLPDEQNERVVTGEKGLRVLTAELAE